MLDTFRKIHGPYSLVYLNGKSNELFFIRDSLGRQTLLLGKAPDYLWLTSVADNSSPDFKFIELPPLGLYRIKLDAKIESVDLFLWQDINKHEIYQQQLINVQNCLGAKVNVQNEWIYPRWLGPPRDIFQVRANV